MKRRNLIARKRLEFPLERILIGPSSFLAIVVLAALLSNPLAAHSQALRPGYLSEMPAPARILAEIKGKDLEDAAERQLGAFITLRTMIGDLAYGLEHRFESQLTPDEQRIQLAYYNAYVDLWHKTKDKFGKQYEGSYDHDRDLRNELLDKFFSADFKALFTKSNQQTAKQIQAARDRANGNVPANKGAGQTATPVGGPGTTAEMNRCVASGRSLRRCFTDVMSAGFAPFALGINPAEPIPIPPGLRMTGDYAGANGFRVIFEPEAATLVCRGVPSPLPYTVEITNTEVLVNVQNGSKPLVFSLRQDGKLSSSGPIRVTGQVPAGSHTEQTMGTTTQQTTRQRELTPLEASQYPNATKNGQVYNVNEDATQLVYGPTGKSTVTDFVTKTADCNGGLLSPIGGSPLPMIKEINSNPIAMLTTIFSGTATLMNGGSTQDSFEEMLSPKSEKPIAPGLRMHGRYVGSTGFSLTFHAESVTLGCGQAEQALAYSVERLVGSSRVDLQACKLEYSIVSPK